MDSGSVSGDILSQKMTAAVMNSLNSLRGGTIYAEIWDLWSLLVVVIV